MYQFYTSSLLGNNILTHTHARDFSLEEILALRFSEKQDITSNVENLYDPYLLKDMDKAVERIKQAVKNKETVVVFGDYDVDGVTSTALLVHLFTTLGVKTSYRLPHRVHDGYGLKKYFIDELAEIGVDLIITVDCGSRDREIVTYGKEKGIDIIVTDHHHIPPEMPDDAVAFINPNRPDCNYPDKYLSGAGVAFKMIMALAKEFFSPQKAEKYILESIDIAAIGTVADCMILTGENRIIVTEGLKQIKKSRSRGIRKLIEERIHEDIDADIFGFQIGPRLNAAGRLDTPYKALNLILNNSESVSDTLSEIETLNELRKQKTSMHTESALEKVHSEDNIIFYESTEIEHGIIGIVAGRLTEKYFKPSIVLKDEGEKLIASCRSPNYFSLIDILEKYKDMFLAYGGHKNAAGFSISSERFPEFKRKILEEVNMLDFSEYQKEIKVDKILKLDQIGFKILEVQNRFKPFGMGNEKPLFMIENFIPEKVSFLGKGREHIKFENRYGFKIFGFFFGEYYETIKKTPSFDIIIDISVDNFNGQKGIMLKIVDIVL